MAYTTLPTQSAGQTASAAGWANIVKADLESMMHLVVRKTADESVVSNATPQNDDVLLMAIAANEVWRYEFMLLAEGSFDLSIGFSFPSGTLSYLIQTANSGGAATQFGSSTTSSPTGVLANVDINATPNTVPVFIRGVFVNGVGAGNLQLMWAQVASGGTATTVKANSTLFAMKLG